MRVRILQRFNEVDWKGQKCRVTWVLLWTNHNALGPKASSPKRECTVEALFNWCTINSYHLINYLIELLLALFYGEERDSERLKTLPKATQLESGRGCKVIANNNSLQTLVSDLESVFNLAVTWEKLTLHQFLHEDDISEIF